MLLYIYSTARNKIIRNGSLELGVIDAFDNKGNIRKVLVEEDGTVWIATNGRFNKNYLKEQIEKSLWKKYKGSDSIYISTYDDSPNCLVDTTDEVVHRDSASYRYFRLYEKPNKI